MLGGTLWDNRNKSAQQRLETWESFNNMNKIIAFQTLIVPFFSNEKACLKKRVIFCPCPLFLHLSVKKIVNYPGPSST